MQGEYEHSRREADDYKQERDHFAREFSFLNHIEAIFFTEQLASRDAMRTESDDARVKEANERARLAEEKFNKLKNVYETFRGDHVNVSVFFSQQKIFSRC